MPLILIAKLFTHNYLAMPYERAEALIDNRRYKLAIEELQKLKATKGDDAFLYLLLTVCYHELGDIVSAISAGTKAIELEPSNYYCFYNLAKVYCLAEDYEEALEMVHTAITIRPNDEDVHYLLARIHFDRGAYKQANIAINKALEINPNAATTLGVKARILIELNQLEEAAIFTQKSLEKDPTNAHNHLVYGNLLCSQKKWKEAQVAYLDALRIEPDFEQASYGLRQTYRFDSRLYRIYHSIHRFCIHYYFLITSILYYLYFFGHPLFYPAIIVTLFLYFPEPATIFLLWLNEKKRQSISRIEKVRSGLFYGLIGASLLFQFLFQWYATSYWLPISYFVLFNALYIFGFTNHNSQKGIPKSAALILFAFFTGIFYVSIHVFNGSIFLKSLSESLFFGLSIAYTSLLFYWDKLE